ncbi:uncharacterized protein [Prorops nasuta]|uniref:uncharacterized protein isoform X2 n=1 Tax=Prorops nasuta TaxID=863751 RepID=UPI0034CFD103
MAVVSDSMFNSCSTTTFVSSNAYYGYVPPCSTRVAQNRLLDFTGSGCSLTNQMETDEDCSPQVNNFTFAEQNHRFLEQYEQPSGQTNALRSRNRKRGNAESASSMSISQQKKFREGSPKDHGLAKVYYESAQLLLNRDSKTQEQFLKKNKNCCHAAARSSAIYEKMLFETHGCLMYHHQRQQQMGIDALDTEF